MVRLRTAPSEFLFVRHPDGDWLVGEGPFLRRKEPDAEQPSFYLPDFFCSDREPWWVPSGFARLSSAELAQLVERWPAETPSWDWQEPEKEAFARDFAQIQELIAQGELNKAVPVVFSRAEARPSKAHLGHWMSRAASTPHRLMAYGGWWGGEGLFGLSPEILFSSQPGSANQPGFTETMALAGTAPVGEELLARSKDRFEHQLVVSDIEARLSLLAEVRKTPTREWVLGRLKHLRTDLAVFASAPFMELVGLLHPTPALGVSPRAKGLSVLRQSAVAGLRRRFGAPFGVHIPGEMSFCVVAIRNIQWHDGYVWLGSGCGVVSQSDLESEWRELGLKRRHVREILGL